MRYEAYLTAKDEPPLLDFLRGTGGRIIRIFSPVWPPPELTAPPCDCSGDECLAIWHADVISEAELLLPDCQPEKGPHHCYDAWSLPFITYQRQWYRKKQATIFAVEMDYRGFRPNRPEDAVFLQHEIDDFGRRLALLNQHAEAIAHWCKSRLRYGYIGEHAWQESDVLRQFAEWDFQQGRGSALGDG